MNGTGEHGHGPSIRIDVVPSASALGGENVRSPVVITPTTIESTGLPTPVAADSPRDADAKTTRPAQVRSAGSGQGRPEVRAADVGQVNLICASSSRALLTYIHRLRHKSQVWWDRSGTCRPQAQMAEGRPSPGLRDTAPSRYVEVAS